MFLYTFLFAGLIPAVLAQTSYMNLSSIGNSSMPSTTAILPTFTSGAVASCTPVASPTFINGVISDCSNTTNETALSNGLALTPPMGFSSWNMFGDAISEDLFRDTIDTMSKNGLRDAGYIYVNLDDGWQQFKGNRSDHPGSIQPDPAKFPSGLKALADYAHSKGFKLGIYSGPGDTTCAGYTGSLGYEEEDAATFASWGIDHLKYDSCCSSGNTAPVPEMKAIMRKMSSALLAHSQPMVFHACHCGWASIWEWAAEEGANQWRIGQDISDDFDYPGNREKYYFDVLDMLDRGKNLTQYSGPGHWNDYDMLIVGLDGNSSQLVGTGLSNIQYRTHFSMWAMVASPLLIGSDVRTLDAYNLATLINPEVIAISQDPLGNAAELVGAQGKNGELEIYAKQMADESWAVALLNRGSTTADMSVSPRRDLAITWDKYLVRDCWRHKDLGPYDIPYTVEVRGNEAKILRITEMDAIPSPAIKL